MDLQPGQHVDRFEVVALLGEGASARVYRVRHRALGTHHALKLLSVPRPDLRERMLQEGRVQARLGHPGVVPVTDVIEHDGAVGLVMEFVDGEPLDDLLAREGPLPVDEALALFDGILDAVEAAHDAGVLHRDLKPGNILLADGPRVTDFGIAKVVTNDTRLGRTRARTMMGTPGYAAPEQWADSSTVDVRADVFSLGVILFEMIAGRLPYAGTTSADILTATVMGDHPPMPASTPPHVARAVNRAISPRPEERFATVADLRHALATPDPAPRRSWWALALVVPPMGIAALAMSFVALGVLLLVDGSPEEPVADPDACHGDADELIGYWYAGRRPRLEAGQSWTLPMNTNVRADFPRADNDWNTRAEVQCVLRKGQVVRVGDSPIRVHRRHVWVPLLGGDLLD